MLPPAHLTAWLLSLTTNHFAANLDPALADFLKKHFPKEVKAKQKENEQALVQEQFGRFYEAKCDVM